MSNNGTGIKENLFNYCLQLADDRLILGHRLSQLCGHGPFLEEDIASTNIALDLIGQASSLYEYAAKVEDKGRNEDDLVYKRDERQFKSLLLVEQPNVDFAYVTARQFFFDAYSRLLFEELKGVKDETLAGIAAKSLKEVKYHIRHSSQWMIRLGDGTEESHNRLRDAVDYLWEYTGEMFESMSYESALSEVNLAADPAKFKDKWAGIVKEVFEKATLPHPDFEAFFKKGGRKGIHNEHLGHLLSEMQILHRSYPEMDW